MSTTNKYFNKNQRVQDKITTKKGIIEETNLLKLKSIRTVLVKFDDNSKRIYIDTENEQLLPYPNDYFVISSKSSDNSMKGR